MIYEVAIQSNCELKIKQELREKVTITNLYFLIFFHFKDRLFIVPGHVNGLKPIL